MLYVLVLLLGLSVGSFLNVAIYRLPRFEEGLAITRPARSFCPLCKAQIPWHDNLPVVGWLMLRAKCRACRAPISIRYPLIELLAGVLSILIFQHDGLTWRFLFDFFWVMCLLTIAFIDLETMRIPSPLIHPAWMVGGLVIAAIEPQPMFLAGPWLTDYLSLKGAAPWLISLAGSALGCFLGWFSLWSVSMLYQLLRKQEGMGNGDPPLLAMIGAYLGWRSIFVIILWSTVIGLVAVALITVVGKRFKDQKGNLLQIQIPYGPLLVVAALIYFFYGPEAMAWYWSLSAPAV